MPEAKREFTGVFIHKVIWMDKDLSWMEKLFLAEINALDGKDGCYASNAHFADFFQLSKARCSQIIKSLEEKSFISIDLQRKGKLISKRVLRILNTPIKNTKYGSKNSKYGSKNSKQGIKNIIKGDTHIDNHIDYKSIFEQFRKKYEGTKLGLDTEFKNFKTKHKDWKEVITLLLPAHESELHQRKLIAAKNQFVPNLKHLKTWINNRSWETEYEETHTIHTESCPAYKPNTE
jgi:hypothetical protein